MLRDELHQYQPNEYSCGATCASIIIEQQTGNKLSVGEIESKYDISPLYGTRSEVLKTILEDNSIKFTHIKHNIASVLEALNKNEYVVCFVSLPSGIPHWIICGYLIDDQIRVFDPAGGIYNISKQKLSDLLIVKKYGNYDPEIVSMFAGEYKCLAIKNSF
jgi:hypothetical protein